MQGAYREILFVVSLTTKSESPVNHLFDVSLTSVFIYYRYNYRYKYRYRLDID